MQAQERLQQLVKNQAAELAELSEQATHITVDAHAMISLGTSSLDDAIAAISQQVLLNTQSHSLMHLTLQSSSTQCLY